ncbi:hypothetical protein CPB83DRAFT_848401 [Crepidotus variabilis]|uniref:Uncharacterized protein n=1 Tax=Crepidotus variabilis TaxID=179855 RepID=A0A9P6EMK6_9AGAR|nr:hypothetical protein CPB83DRAFT_848401 [Crepidotus variabilis]
MGKALRSMKAPGTAYDDPVFGSELFKRPPTREVCTYTPGVPKSRILPRLVATELGGQFLGSRRKNLAFAKLTIEKAGSLYDRSVKAVVEHAWKEVGVDTGAKEKPVPKPQHPPCSKCLDF